MFSSVHQVISQFATISQSTGDASYPEPASTFVRALSVSNFEILGLVPLGCVTHGMSFYHKILLKVSTPVIIIGLLWCYPLTKAVRGQPIDEASRTVKRLVLLMLELTLPSITTSLIQVFICSEFENGWFLSEELTLACDDSDQRAFWVAITVIGLMVYPLGGKFRKKPKRRTTS